MDLRNSTVYLGGAVESASNPHNWRKEISEQLAKFDMVSWDPLVKPVWFPNITPDEQRSWKDVIREQHKISIVGEHQMISTKVETTWDINKELRQFCMHLAANANMVVVKLDKTFTVGTFFELAVCKYKPVFILTDDPALSTWLIAELDIEPNEMKECFHKDIDSLMTYLKDIKEDKIAPYNLMKWSYRTYQI